MMGRLVRVKAGHRARLATPPPRLIAHRTSAAPNEPPMLAASETDAPGATAPPTSPPRATPRRRVVTPETAIGPVAVARDFVDGFALNRVWLAFAWDDVQNRYRRSVLGIAWIGLSYLFFVFAILVLFRGYTLGSSDAFLHYVAIGYASFVFLSGHLGDGCEVFRSNKAWVKAAPLPRSIYVYKNVARALFPFAIQLALALGVMTATGWRPGPVTAMTVPALLAWLLTALPIQMLLGHLAARLQDVRHLVQTVQRMLFFLSPVLWVLSERDGLARTLALLNPVTHYMEVFRAPLLGEPVLAISWVVVMLTTAASWILCLLIVGRMRAKLPFWL